MKLSILPVLLLLFFATTMNAQQFAEAVRPMSQGDHNSYMLDFKIGDADNIGKLWADYQKSFKTKKPKEDRKTKEYFADDATISSISDNTIDIYSTVKDKGTSAGAFVTVWFDLGGAYLSSSRHPDRIEAAKTWLQGFQEVVAKEYAAETLKAEEDLLKNMEKELKNLEKDKDSATSEIKDLEKALEEAKANLKTAEKAVSTKQEEVNKQSEMVKSAKQKLKKM